MVSEYKLVQRVLNIRLLLGILRLLIVVGILGIVLIVRLVVEVRLLLHEIVRYFLDSCRWWWRV